MTITLSQAITNLTNGTPLTWEASGSYKGGTIHLEKPGQRRLFDFLASQNLNDVASADDSLFNGLTAAWNDDESDPADQNTAAQDASFSGPWRLVRIEATGFGGLNTPGGPPFELEVYGENWCLEGYNGSGKTSLASLILWTLTGYRNREQDGPQKDIGLREPVKDGAKKIGTWPPLVTYPLNPVDLKKTASVSGKLTFADPAGNLATAIRFVESPVDGDPVVTENIDARLLAMPQLIETGLLMPARIGHVGFGSKSQTLYQALKMLTGLDQLAAIGTGAAGFGHGAKRFLKYAKDNGIDGFERDFKTCLESAREQANNTVVDLAKDYRLGDENLVEELTAIEEDASTRAGAALSILKAEIAADIDVDDADDRTRLNNAVSKARVYVGEGANGVPLFKTWAALKLAGESGFSDIGEALESAKASLTTALVWHDKQKSDEKLRLKALASRFYVSEDHLSEKAHCPLCETQLSSDEQLALAAELAGLKSDAKHAERAIADACHDIEKIVKALIPNALQPHFTALSKMDPATAFSDAVRARFSDESPFADVLTGIAFFVKAQVDKMSDDLPAFTHTMEANPASEIPEVENLRLLLADMSRVSLLTTWWTANRMEFVTAWKSLIGEKDDEDGWPSDCIEGKLQTLEDAIAGSDPLDKIAKQMAAAKTAAEPWATIQSVQQTRIEIVTALEPIKKLQQLVDCETHRTVATLKDRVAAILDDIRLKDRLSFRDTAMAKKGVTVEGGFAEGMQIDASLVANSSWLRALLWAFIFGLREQSIADAGANIFPLMVLDDPQTTFDPKNKRKWAAKIVDIANVDPTDPSGMQLFLATHERQFYDIVCETCELDGQEGKMAGPTSTSKVAHVVNGTFLDRQFSKASVDRDDEEGYRYVLAVRVYCEDLLKIILRPESYEISGDTLGKFCELLSKLSSDEVAPYNRSVFQKLIKLLNEQSVPVIKIINASHHTYDGTIGYAQAEEVHKYWKEKLQTAFINAFRLAADFDAYGGVSRLFAWEDNVIAFPDGHTDEIKALAFTSTGVAAAAESDGLVGSGHIEIEEWQDAEAISLFKHSAYRLNAGTLDPVAEIGDIILVQDFGEPRSRNLTVTALGDKLYARRLNETEDHTDVVILTAQATDPYALPDPVIALKSKISPRKIVGTLFMPQSAQPPQIDGNEVSAVSDFAMIETRVKGAKLFKVKGRSMEPVALDGQYLMTVEESLDVNTLKRLSGELVIAVDEDAGVYFKRLRLHGNFIVLESANSSHTTSSEILSLEDEADLKRLSSLRSVVGVLFDLPTAN
ncbi:hypothetical protein [uncultured Roseobacter sp.]|uniref:S24 family peptidase n=1 Tax=uncultured Roseobacter sp. TaxID=114847 RepID=UPI002622A22D|nr:hypothetical protein [uncultured Roseobacter sp.]